MGSTGLSVVPKTGMPLSPYFLNAQGDLKMLPMLLRRAAASRVPVLNMQCDRYHPHQILADLLTVPSI